jgi:hypothetical protein
MRLIRYLTIVPAMLMLSLLTLTGCAMHGKSPQRQIASIGVQVISGLDAATKTAGELHASKVITDAQYEAFLVKMKVVYQQASRLGDALQAYNTNASTDTASQVKAALDSLAVLVPQLSSQIGGTAGAKIAELISQVNQLIINIAAAIAPQARAMPLFEPEVCFG